MTEYEKQIEHLTDMSKTPGFRDYLVGNSEGIGRLDELDKAQGFIGIKADLFRRVREEKEKK